MTLLGLGALFTRGRGANALCRAVREGWRPPADLSAPFAPGGAAPAYGVDLAALGDAALLSKLRRADRFTQLATIAARDAFADARLEAAPPERVGLILASALGPHVTTFRFLDEILTYGDRGGSAFVFSHSVHNAAASYVATLLGLQGPAITVAQTDFAFHEGLALASCWLAAGRCERVLVGAVDELGEVMRYVAARQCPPPGDGRARPLAFSTQPRGIPGEGAFFLSLGPAGLAGARGTVAVGCGRPAPAPVVLVDADGLSCDESRYTACVPAGCPLASYVALSGGLLTAGAFHAALAAASLQDAGPWPAPDAAGVDPAAVRPDSAVILRVSGAGEAAWIRVEDGRR